MKKLALLALGIIGLASIAATCVIKNATLTEIDGNLTYGAEMNNGTEANILNHKFKLAFISDDNDVLEILSVDGCFQSIQSDASDFFSASSDDPDAEKVLARLDGPYTFGEVAPGDFAIDNIEVTRDGESLVVTGRIENDGNDELDDARVCIIVYNDDDQVVVTQRDNQTFDLDGGDTANFSVTITVPDDANDVDHVSVGVDAINTDEDDAPTDPIIEADNEVDECDDATSTPTSTTPTNTPPAGATATNTPVPDAC